jgi:rhamnosyltransferase subunit B
MTLSNETSLTILMFTFGSLGEVYPYVALGRVLRQRGHRVGLGVDDQFRNLCLEQGLDFLPIDPLERKPGRPGKNNWITRGLTAWSYRSARILELMPTVYQTIERERVPGRTVVVGKSYMFGARIAREKLGVPLATLHLTPAMVRSEYEAPGLPIPRGGGLALRLARRLTWYAIDRAVEPMVAPGLNQFRSQLGLPAVSMPFRGWHLSPQLGIGLFPDWFAQPKPDWPDNTRLVGFPQFEALGSSGVPEELESFLTAGEPPVLFTLGRNVHAAGRFFTDSVTACRLLKRRGLLLGPAEKSVPSGLPATIRHFGYVPFGAVFPRVAAIVHHGGVGTTGLALASGRPQIVVSRVDDQRDNGLRVEALGAGTTTPFAGYSGERAAEQLARLFESAQVENRCRELSERTRQVNGIDNAADLIEQLGR